MWRIWAPKFKLLNVDESDACACFHLISTSHYADVTNISRKAPTHETDLCVWICGTSTILWEKSFTKNWKWYASSNKCNGPDRLTNNQSPIECGIIFRNKKTTQRYYKIHGCLTPHWMIHPIGILNFGKSSKTVFIDTVLNWFDL